MNVLISAYACEPGHGSERGAGWIWSLAAALKNDVWVITRSHTQGAIEAALRGSEQPTPRFVYLDLPGLRRWATREAGFRHYLYYVLWQLRAAREARKLSRLQRFDLVHHLTYGSIWLPNLAWLAGRPFVLGPAGGGPRIPPRLYRVLGVRGAARELVRLTAQVACRFNPLVRAGWRRAALIMVQNEETLQALPRRHRSRAVVLPHASAPAEIASVSERSVPARARTGRRNAVAAGRLLPWKALLLAIRALEAAPDWELVIVGQGPQRSRLQRLVARRGLGDRVRFVPWMEQSELWAFLSSADALVLPSLRDDAPLVVAEALMLGLPVVAFDQGGPAVFARAPGAQITLVPRGSEDACIRGLAEALKGLTPRRPGSSPDFSVGKVADALDSVYRSVVEAGH